MSKERAGTYSVTVEGWSSSFSVSAPIVPAGEEEEVITEIPGAGSIAWWAWLLIVVAATAIVGVIVWLEIKRRRGSI